MAYWSCAGRCGGRLTVFAVHTPPSSGRPQPASLCFRVREAQVPCYSTHCPGRPPHMLPHSVGCACAGRVPCWLWVACASQMCAPSLHCDPPSSLVLPTLVLSEVPSLTWPTIPFHRAPQEPQRWPTGYWVPWAQTNNSAVPQGPQGWLPGCLIPCAHWWLHRTHQGPQWWPTGCRVPWAHADKDFALQGPQGWPSGCPIPCAHSPFHVSSQGPCWPLGVRSHPHCS